MKHLIIVESPSKAKTIQKYLGSDAVVLASKGHVCDLPQRTLGIDIEHGFKPQYVITPDKEETIRRLSQAVDKYEKVYLATDPDREGEAISWHLKNTLGIKGDKVRIEFNEISPRAVRAAMENPREIDMNLVDSQQARRVLDRLVGYKISPILARKIKAGKKSGLSAGRVQSAALKMIVDRENEIRDFKPEEYWNIFAMLLKEGAPKKEENLFKAAFNDLNGEKTEVKEGALASCIADMMRRSRYFVDEVKKMSIRDHNLTLRAEVSSSDIQTIAVEVGLVYSLDPQQVGRVFQTYGQDIERTLLRPTLSEKVNAVIAEYPIEAFVEKRAEISDRINTTFAEQVAGSGIQVKSLLITSHDFSDEFNKAIEDKKIAEQGALTAKFTLERMKLEAEAQKVKQASLSEMVLQEMAINKWDGKLPQYFSGDQLPFITLK